MVESAGMRIGALAAVFTLVVGGAVGCGSGDDGDGSGAASAPPPASANGDPKQQVRDDFDDYVRDLYKGRWQQVCERIATGYEKQFLKEVNSSDSCVKTTRRLFSNVGTQPRPWITNVELNGPNDAVGVSLVREGGVRIRIKFVREDGVWKLAGPADKGYGDSVL